MKGIKYKKTKEEKIKYLKEKGISFWFPDAITYPSGKNHEMKRQNRWGQKDEI